jgi:NAD(P)-dependent dehydrogenase (short-subunit alcohol dehydrogenase family)
VQPFQLDVTDEAAVRALFAAVAVDILVCAAGVGVFAPIIKAEVADLRAMLEVHVVGGFLCARELLRQPRPPHPRTVVLVSSLAALRTFGDCGAYSAAKEGLRGLGRVLCEEARPLDVRVTLLHPGAVDTPIWDTRAGFDRDRMLRPASLAGLVADIVARPELAVDELTVMPPAGAL